MSSMLEQAIVDAAALREAALKNAEQSVIEKYAPEIKSAVESLLGDDDEEVLQELSEEVTTMTEEEMKAREEREAEGRPVDPKWM